MRTSGVTKNMSNAQVRTIKEAKQANSALAQSLKRVTIPFITLFSLFLLLNLAGCAGTKENTYLEIASQPVYFTDYQVLRDAPVVHVSPVTEAGGGLKVLFVPFRVTQKMDNSELMGYTVGKLFWQNWAANKIFEYMEYSPDAGPFRLSTALAIARSRGADMIVSGYVTHILSGSNIAGSALSLQIEGYDVSSGILVWSMAQGAALPRPQSNDYILFSTRNKMPADPIYALTNTIASDMGAIMRSWSKYDEVQAEEAKKARLEEEERIKKEQESFMDKIGNYMDDLF